MSENVDQGERAACGGRGEAVSQRVSVRPSKQGNEKMPHINDADEGYNSRERHDGVGR